MIGIILFILWNNYDSFSVGIEWIVTWDEADVQEGRAVFDSENDAHDFYTLHADYPNIQLPVEEGEPSIEEDEPSCSPIPDNVISRMCEALPPSSCASRASSLQGPMGCNQQPQLEGGGAAEPPSPSECERFFNTSAIKCLQPNEIIMKQLFDLYKQLSILLSMPEDTLTQIPDFQALNRDVQFLMERDTRLGPAFSLIFSYLRENSCQFYRFVDVLDILDNISFTERGIPGPVLLKDRDTNEIINSDKNNKICKIIIYILLFLLNSGFNNSTLRYQSYYLFIQDCIHLYSRRDVTRFTWTMPTFHNNIYTILYSILTTLINPTFNNIHQIIYNWMSEQGDRFNDIMRGSHDLPAFYLNGIPLILNYDEYISLFQYLAVNDICPNIMEALLNPIFRDFFGLP